MTFLFIEIELYRDTEGRRQNSLPLTTDYSQNVTEPSKGINYPVDDLCRPFTKLTGPCAYTLHSNPIPSINSTNGLLRLVAYISPMFPSMFLSSFCGEIDVSPKRVDYQHWCIQWMVGMGYLKSWPSTPKVDPGAIGGFGGTPKLYQEGGKCCMCASTCSTVKYSYTTPLFLNCVSAAVLHLNCFRGHKRSKCHVRIWNCWTF